MNDSVGPPYGEREGTADNLGNFLRTLSTTAVTARPKTRQGTAMPTRAAMRRGATGADIIIGFSP